MLDTPINEETHKSKLSYAGLKKQRDELEQQLQEMKEESQAEFRGRIEAEAKDLDLDLYQMYGSAPKATRNGSRTPAKAKYKLPGGDTWSGKGRLPLALREHLKGADGYDEETGNFEDKESRQKAIEKYLIG